MKGLIPNRRALPVQPNLADAASVDELRIGTHFWCKIPKQRSVQFNPKLETLIISCSHLIPITILLPPRSHFNSTPTSREIPWPVRTSNPIGKQPSSGPFRACRKSNQSHAVHGLCPPWIWEIMDGWRRRYGHKMMVTHQTTATRCCLVISGNKSLTLPTTRSHRVPRRRWSRDRGGVDSYPPLHHSTACERWMS